MKFNMFYMEIGMPYILYLSQLDHLSKYQYNQYQKDISFYSLYKYVGLFHKFHSLQYMAELLLKYQHIHQELYLSIFVDRVQNQDHMISMLRK